eukprot:GHVU01136976.1.p1 GENE.GHVU01136976.1~~GHVU01136976.1.p1  ORF type:complete len:199 (+),score=21.74 GHVU01136976.1:79-675(+)
MKAKLFGSFVVVVCALLHGVEGSDVIELTDANFEHDTQISTGATTGTWFVKFFAAWCGHCQSLAPTWETLATDLKGRVNIAKVDVPQNAMLQKRFKIRGFPTLMLFHNGRVYDYSGARALMEMKKFALGGYEQTTSKKVPGVPSAWTATQDFFRDLIMTIGDTFIRRPAAALVIMAAGAMVGSMMTMVVAPAPKKKTS